MTVAPEVDIDKREGFHHVAMFYAGDREFVANTLPFVLEGVDAGEPVLALIPEPRLSLLQSAVESVTAPGRVAFVDMGVAGKNPARIIPVWRDFLDASREHGPVRGIGEPIWAGRTEEELVECQLHEALLNVAFDGAGAVRILCPYDTGRLDTSVLEEAHRSHPWLTGTTSSTCSGTFDHDRAFAEYFQAPLRPPPLDATIDEFDGRAIGTLRHRVAAFTRDAGFFTDDSEELVLAVIELAANSVHHGGGTGTLRMWCEGTSIICEVADNGHIADPLVGRRRPTVDQKGGRGLWLANQVSDLVQIRNTATGVVIRVHKHRRDAAPH
jgi:anti-sigma regulatory factor (Ser/Thr protein kinase)